MRFLLLLALLSGCATNAALRLEAEAAHTFEEVSALVELRSIRAYLVDAAAPLVGVGLRVTPTHLEWDPAFGYRVPTDLARVERIEVDRRGNGHVLWSIAGATIGVHAAVPLARRLCQGKPLEDALACILLVDTGGLLLGGSLGLRFGVNRSRRDPPVIVYQGLPDRYGVR